MLPSGSSRSICPLPARHEKFWTPTNPSGISGAGWLRERNIFISVLKRTENKSRPAPGFFRGSVLLLFIAACRFLPCIFFGMTGIFFYNAFGNKRFGNDKIQTVRSYIDSSVAVCIFGMSLGATDKMWWNYICKWLQGADKRRLIIFSKPDQDMPRITKHRLFFSENIVLENLRVNSGINDAEWNRIVGKIFIKFDGDLFDFKLV